MLGASPLLGPLKSRSLRAKRFVDAETGTSAIAFAALTAVSMTKRPSLLKLLAGTRTAMGGVLRYAS